ncbi:hypothetical protein BJ741DRAFT_709181 [Chytriomyces cf. hyalinus JEL632]|nr:hypothetical protein BJ741DRAFT_709181 [Chytriomyces cf. hyalinus JEL632]
MKKGGKENGPKAGKKEAEKEGLVKGPRQQTLSAFFRPVSLSQVQTNTTSASEPKQPSKAPIPAPPTTIEPATSSIIPLFISTPQLPVKQRVAQKRESALHSRTSANAAESVDVADALGVRGQSEALSWLNLYAKVDLDTLEDHTSTAACCGPFDADHLLDLSMVADFLSQFGSALLGLEVDKVSSIESLFSSLETSTTVYKYLAPLYSSLIIFLHHHERKRWSTMTAESETQGLIIHHLLTVPLSSTSISDSHPSIDALISIFTRIPFPRIPPQIHLHLLTILVETVLCSAPFHEHMEQTVFSVMETCRKSRAANSKRRLEIRARLKHLDAAIDAEKLGVKRVERELRSLGCVVPTFLKNAVADVELEEEDLVEDTEASERDAGAAVDDVAGDASVSETAESVQIEKEGERASTASPSSTVGGSEGASRRQAIEEDKKRKESEKELLAKLKTLVKEVNAKISESSALDRELEKLEKTDAALKEESEALHVNLRVNRALGSDRDFSTYYWMDLHENTEKCQAADETSHTKSKPPPVNSIFSKTLSNTANKPVPLFGILIVPNLQSQLDIPASPASSEPSPSEHLSGQSASRCISTLSDLKCLVQSLDKNCLRESALLTAIRDRLKPFNLDIPSLSSSTSSSSNAKKAQKVTGSATCESAVDSAMTVFGDWISRVTSNRARNVKDLKHAVDHDAESILEGIHIRIRDLHRALNKSTKNTAAISSKLPTDRDISKFRSRPEIISAIQTCICNVYGADEGDAVAARLHEVAQMTLLSVAVGFVVADVKRGKLGDSIGGPAAASQSVGGLNGIDLKAYENAIEDLDALIRRDKKRSATAKSRRAEHEKKQKGNVKRDAGTHQVLRKSSRKRLEPSQESNDEESDSAAGVRKSNRKSDATKVSYEESENDDEDSKSATSETASDGDDDSDAEDVDAHDQDDDVMNVDEDESEAESQQGEEQDEKSDDEDANHEVKSAQPSRPTRASRKRTVDGPCPEETKRVTRLRIAGKSKSDEEPRAGRASAIEKLKQARGERRSR